MVLPAGVNKATGLAAALDELGAVAAQRASASATPRTITPSCALCECSVAVANALPTIKERADVVTKGEAGAGVEELAAELVATDLSTWEPQLRASLGAARPARAREGGETA